MQYDNPILSSEVTEALNANTNLSATTVNAISQILDLNTASTVVVGSWDGVGTVIAPAGESAQAIIADVAGAAGTDVTVGLNADGLDAAKAFVFSSDANLTLDFTYDGADTNERVIVSGNGNDTITVAGGNTVVDGGAGNDTISTGNGADLIIAGSGDNSITTGYGNDTIIAGTGNDTINAGVGYDTVVVSGSKADFTATVNDTDLVLTNGSHTITTSNAEFISFDNGASIAVVGNDDEAAALRLYDALLGRDADAEGAQNWTSAVDNGTSLTDVANAFLSSTEYQNKANADFVNSLYSNLLGRDADSEGQATWLNALASGESRADVVNAIAGSAEATAANTTDAQYVAALYSSVLGRSADDAGLTDWTNALANGTDRATVAEAFADSSEASAKVTSDFLDNLYEEALGRTADAQGKADWTAALANGATQAEVAIAIVGSDEAVAHNTSVVVVHGVA